MPRTPCALRPIGRTSFSSKRTALPPELNSITSCAPSVSATPISASPSVRSTAMMPDGRGRENSESGVFFTVPDRSRHEHELVVGELLDRQDRGDLLVVDQRHEVDDRLAARRARALRHVVDLEPVHAAAVGEAEDVVVRVRDEHAVDEIVFLGRGGLLAAAAALLRAIFVDRLRLHVAAVRERDDHVLRRDQVLDRQVDALRDDLRAARVAELVADRA